MICNHHLDAGMGAMFRTRSRRALAAVPWCAPFANGFAVLPVSVVALVISAAQSWKSYWKQKKKKSKEKARVERVIGPANSSSTNF